MAHHLSWNDRRQPVDPPTAQPIGPEPDVPFGHFYGLSRRRKAEPADAVKTV
jgi:hypothetical protein